MLAFPRADGDSKFMLRHYAGEVEYSVSGFREKNKDSMHPDMVALLQSSADPFISALFPVEEAPVETSPNSHSFPCCDAPSS